MLKFSKLILFLYVIKVLKFFQSQFISQKYTNCHVQFLIQEILADRENTGSEILTQLDVATDPWGIRSDFLTVNEDHSINEESHIVDD